MATARVVVLGAIQRVLSLARRRHGYLVGRQAGEDVAASSSPLFQGFALLHARLLRCEGSDRMGFP